MNPHPARRFICAVSAFVLCAGVVRAADEAERTVFWPPDYCGTARLVSPVASPLDRFEFRGVLTIGAETFVTLIDTATRRALTAALGDTVDGVTVASFQSETGSVLLTAGDQSRRLALPDAKIVAVVPPTHVTRSRPRIVPGSENQGDSRMQDVAREIQRRREIRRQMLGAQPPPVAPATTR